MLSNESLTKEEIKEIYRDYILKTKGTPVCN